jgi:uncharacterized membrane protein
MPAVFVNGSSTHTPDFFAMVVHRLAIAELGADKVHRAIIKRAMIEGVIVAIFIVLPHRLLLIELPIVRSTLVLHPVTCLCCFCA